jgi:hypothetical protein
MGGGGVGGSGLSVNSTMTTAAKTACFLCYRGIGIGIETVAGGDVGM